MKQDSHHTTSLDAHKMVDFPASILSHRVSHFDHTGRCAELLFSTRRYVCHACSWLWRWLRVCRGAAAGSNPSAVFCHSCGLSYDFGLRKTFKRL